MHYHFETREALLGEALEYSYEHAGQVRRADGDDEEEADPQRRLLAMVDQCLPYPGELRQDWVLWLELWLRTVRYPELAPTAARLYERMRDWLSEGIEACRAPSDLDAGELADRALAMCDGLGVRVLIGEMPIEYAREQVWGYLARELNLDGSLTGG